MVQRITRRLVIPCQGQVLQPAGLFDLSQLPEKLELPKVRVVKEPVEKSFEITHLGARLPTSSRQKLP
jgi:hypothetical protein